MELELLGNVGYQVGAVGILFVTVIYYISVRWWTDPLGRTLAAVLGTVSTVLIMSILRMLDVPIPNLLLWRALVFWMFGLAVWSGLLTMVWSLFFAPRLRIRSREGRTTHPRRVHEEASMADRRGNSDGHLHHDPGSPDR